MGSGASSNTGKRSYLGIKRLAKGLKKIATPMKSRRLADSSHDTSREGNFSEPCSDHQVLLVDFPMFFSISNGSHYSSSMCFLLYDESPSTGLPSQPSSFSSSPNALGSSSNPQ